MKRDATNIEYCAGMGWKKAEKWLESNAHMLALGKDEDGLQVARAVTGSGPEAGTAVLSAFLALRKNGLPRFAAEAVGIYKTIAKEAARDERFTRKRVETLAHRVHNLEYYVAFLSGSMSCSEFVWPLKMPVEMWAEMGRRSGMANVMMGISIRKLDERTTTEFIAASQMSEFLREGLKEKDA